MGFLKKFFVGMAIFLQLSSPVLIQNENGLSVSISIAALLTEDMKDLLDNGVAFDFELYYSLILEDAEGHRSLMKRKKNLSLSYDFITESYYMNDGIVSSFSTIEELEDTARRFPVVDFVFETNRYVEAEMFFQIRIIDNPIIEDQFGIETDSLWNYYKPSISATWEAQ